MPRTKKPEDRFTFEEADLIRHALVAFMFAGRGEEDKTVAEIELANKLYIECGGHNPIITIDRQRKGNYR